MSRRAVSRRHFTLAAAALAAPVVLPRASLGDDAKVDLVHTFSGADHPIQRVIRAFNDKGTGVTVVSRQDGTDLRSHHPESDVVDRGRPRAIPDDDRLEAG